MASEPNVNAESVRIIVEAWQHKLDACGLELWQRNASTHKGKWGEGPIDLTSLAADAVAALMRRSDGCRCGHARTSHGSTITRCTICECEQSDGPGPEESDTSGAYREGDVTILGDLIGSEQIDGEA